MAAARSRARPPIQRDLVVARAHLAAALAHDIRNPLNFMTMHLELLERRAARIPADEAQAVHKSLAVLQEGVNRIEALLKRYLAHAGPTPGRPRNVTPSDLLARAAERAAPAATARGARIEIVAARGRWRLDDAAASLAVDELLANALDAVRKGGRVVLSAAAASGSASITVADDGEGIAAEDLPRLFTLGFTTRTGRAGVGLTVARQAVKALDGSLIANSDGPGKGATFHVEFPLD
jgi:signal transduction histidine kinase